MRNGMILGLLVLTSACGGETTESVVVKSDEGEKIVAEGNVDASEIKLPLDVPIYPGAKVTSNVSEVSDGRGRAAVDMTTSDAPDKIMEFYRKEAATLGMGATFASASAKSGASFSVTNDDGDRIMVEVKSAEQGLNKISLVIDAE
jgi:hypothetical protein